MRGNECRSNEVIRRPNVIQHAGRRKVKNVICTPSMCPLLWWKRLKAPTVQILVNFTLQPAVFKTEAGTTKKGTKTKMEQIGMH